MAVPAPHKKAGIIALAQTCQNTGMDSLGAMETSKDFMVAGTAPNSLWGVCETFFRPNLGPEELFETISQCLLSGVDRDALSGWGAVVYVM